MKTSIKSAALTIFAITLLLSVSMLSSTALADNYPDKSINLVVPYNPGGGSDMICRIMDKYSKDVFGQNLVFVYKPGAGGAMGTTVISRSKPDGYTIGTVNVPHMVLQSLTGSGQFSVDSFEYLGQVASDPQILVTPGRSEIKKLEDFIAGAKKRPGKMTVGVPGALGAGHIASYMIMDKADIQFTIIPYSGGADLLAAVLGNQIDAAVCNIGIVASESDQLNLLAVSHTKRNPFVPDTPTFQDQGYDVVSFIGRLFIAPKGIDEKKLNYLRESIKKISDIPGYQEAMQKSKFSLDYMSGPELQAFLKDYAQASQKLLDKYFKK